MKVVWLLFHPYPENRAEENCEESLQMKSCAYLFFIGHESQALVAKMQQFQDQNRQLQHVVYP